MISDLKAVEEQGYTSSLTGWASKGEIHEVLVAAGFEKGSGAFGDAVAAFRRGLARRAGEVKAADDAYDAERRACGLPVSGDQVICELCYNWLVTYDSSREEQLCEGCTKLAEREKLREFVAAEADDFCQRVETLGLVADRTDSGLSEAVYFDICDPAKEDDEDAEIVKVRMAEHEARPTYLRLNGSPDFEIGNIGGKQYTQDSDGDAAACLAWLKRKFEK